MIIKLGDFTRTGQWHMEIDLEEVCRAAGVKEEYYENGRKKYYVPLKAMQTRKLFSLIRKYADPDQLKEAELFVLKCSNPVAKKAWLMSGGKMRWERERMACPF